MLTKLNNYAVVCEDVRKETDGKLTLVGTFGGGAQVHTPFPTSLKICAVCFMHDISKGDNYEFIVKYADHDELVAGKLTVPNDNNHTMVVIIELSPLNLTKEGVFQVFAKKNSKKQLLTKLRFSYVPKTPEEPIVKTKKPALKKKSVKTSKA